LPHGVTKTGVVVSGIPALRADAGAADALCAGDGADFFAGVGGRLAEVSASFSIRDRRRKTGPSISPSSPRVRICNSAMLVPRRLQTFSSRSLGESPFKPTCASATARLAVLICFALTPILVARAVRLADLCEDLTAGEIDGRDDEAAVGRVPRAC
jgi:hypothetical protein